MRYFLFRSLSFFFNDTAPTEIYTLSLHDALPILIGIKLSVAAARPRPVQIEAVEAVNLFCLGASMDLHRDRKSTRLNSSHTVISYAVFCLKKKKKTRSQNRRH